MLLSSIYFCNLALLVHDVRRGIITSLPFVACSWAKWGLLELNPTWEVG